VESVRRRGALALLRLSRRLLASIFALHERQLISRMGFRVTIAMLRALQGIALFLLFWPKRSSDERNRGP
jgi:hypothetical protein